MFDASGETVAGSTPVAATHPANHPPKLRSVEDYVHSGTKFAIVILVRLACFALVVIGILSILRIATGL